MPLESQTPKVYKNNRLNTADYGKFTHNNYQVFLYLISKLGGVDSEGRYLQPDQLKREHLLTAKEFSSVFNADIDNSYKYLKNAADALMKKDILVPSDRPDTFTRINICSKAEYIKNEGCVSIKFTDDIMPYLAQVHEKFVLYNLKEISPFNSLYSTRLYELVQEFKDTGWMIKSIDQLRKAFAVSNKFRKYSQFKARTFDHACQEINKAHKMNLQYEEIKEGRKIVAIKFTFKKTKIIPIKSKTGKQKNFYIKPEQNILPKKPRTSNKKELNTSAKKINETLSDAPQDHLSNKKETGVFSSFFSRFKK